MFRSSLTISLLMLLTVAPVAASLSSGFIVNFNDGPQDFWRTLGDAEVKSEGGLVIGPNGETSGHLRLGQSDEATNGGIAFTDSFLTDENADTFRLQLSIQGPMNPTELSGINISLVTPNDPATELPAGEADANWFEQLDATSLAGTSIPLLAPQTGVSVGLALTTNGSENAATQEVRPCGDHIGECLSIDLRLDGELIATAEQPVGDELWKTISIGVAPTSLRGLSSFVSITEETGGELLSEEVPILRSISNVVITSDSLPESMGYGVDDVTLLFGESFPDSGDFNEDGAIDIADFLTLAAYMNTQPATHELGDFNFDGRIDVADFVGFRETWQRIQGQKVNTVPEPRGGCVLGFMFVVLLALRQRGKKGRCSW